jgi:NCAIR mutase (PurE)-related protein
MDQNQLRGIFEKVERGSINAAKATDQVLDLLRNFPFEDLGFARVDHQRELRQGFPEVIFGAGKTPGQIAEISKRLFVAGQSLLVTRTDETAYAAVKQVVPQAKFHAAARIISHRPKTINSGIGVVLIAAAGTSDLPIAEEARVSAEILGNQVEVLYDVGIAGLHRLLAERERIDRARVIIAVAGMEGALPSVIGGLVKVPVIAVPTSVGYGANFGGVTALLAMLNSCASGVAVVNIDNGFGAAAMASLINHPPSKP